VYNFPEENKTIAKRLSEGTRRKSIGSFREGAGFAWERDGESCLGRKLNTEREKKKGGNEGAGRRTMLAESERVPRETGPNLRVRGKHTC